MERTILRKDSEWSIVDGEACKVINFTPFATIESGKVVAPNKTEPYASVILECKKLPQKTEGFICHKIDFQHLWAAFNKRVAKENEEIIIFYNKKHLKGCAKFFSFFMPRLWVMICKKGAFELMTNPNSHPELQGEARFLEERPIIEWEPKTMK